MEEDNIVLDRYNLGEFVYPLAYARQPKLTWIEQNKIFEECKNKDVIYIIMYSSNFSVLEKRLSKRGDTEQVLENAKYLNELYIMANYYLCKKYYNIFGIDMSYTENQCDEFEDIHKRLEKMKEFKKGE